MNPQIAVSILSGTTGSNGNDFMDSLLATAENSNVTAIGPAASGKKRRPRHMRALQKHQQPSVLPVTVKGARVAQFVRILL